MVAAVLACTLAVTGALTLTSAAHAVTLEVPVTGTMGRLVLLSDILPASFPDMSPGESEYWRVTAVLRDAHEATLQFEIRKDGELVDHPRGPHIEVDHCQTAWDVTGPVPRCPAGAQHITLAAPHHDYADGSPRFALAQLKADDPVDLLFTLSLEDSAEAESDETLMGLEGEMSFGLTATGALPEAPAPGPEPAPPPTPEPTRPSAPPEVGASGALSATGADPRALLGTLCLAAALLCAGSALRSFRPGERG